MRTQRHHTLKVPISCAPLKASCPTCGKPGRRKQVLRRTVRTIEYRRAAYLDITYGEYRARCAAGAVKRFAPTRRASVSAIATTTRSAAPSSTTG